MDDTGRQTKGTKWNEKQHSCNTGWSQGRPEDENYEGVNNMKNADYNFLLNVCSIINFSL